METGVVIEAGMLLVATPALLDPNFADTVVLMLDVDADGAVGVVLNRPSELAVTEVLASWSGRVAAPDVLWAGLNLTRADHVVHVDRWWNPAVEEQATDRAYRIGQTRPVQVHRMITRGTIEEKVAELLTRIPDFFSL